MVTDVVVQVCQPPVFGMLTVPLMLAPSSSTCIVLPAVVLASRKFRV